MSKATEKRLGVLHSILTEAFIDRIENGDMADDGTITKCAPAVLAAAARFLKDNNIDIGRGEDKGKISALMSAVQSVDMDDLDRRH